MRDGILGKNADDHENMENMQLYTWERRVWLGCVFMGQKQQEIRIKKVDCNDVAVLHTMTRNIAVIM